MANKWVYRRTDLYWVINQETRLMKRVAQQGTTEITGILSTPRQLDKMRMQYWARTARRQREEQYAENVHEIRHVVPPAGPVTYTLYLAGGQT